MSDTAVPTPIPTDPQALYAVLAAVAPTERDAIYNQLVTQLGDEGKADQIFDPIARDVAHGEEIDGLRAELTLALKSAETDTARALTLLDKLTGSRVYDVEYAESRATDDMCAFLADAGRSLRAAAALNPCPTKKST